MEPLTLKQPEEGVEVENWDDDDFDALDEIQLRTASTATSVMSHPQSNHRDSISSRLSIRSDSNQGDENWDVLVDEQAPIKDAVALARSKGIPLPTNVPRSALEGGTIRRLNGKAIKKAIADDWSEDLDLPGSNAPLKLAKHEERDLSESLRQISAAFRQSPVNTKTPEVKDFFSETIKSPKSRPAVTPVSLDQFRDNDDEDSFGDVPTIRVAKHRSPQKPLLFQQPPSKTPSGFESIDEDFELPSDGPLKLSARKVLPKTPQQADEFDAEWAEGSLGTRHAGTRRAGRSNRSSSASALSPSVSSAFTAESEDEGLDGLVLPTGPLKLEEMLKKRKIMQPADLSIQTLNKQSDDQKSANEDFFADFDIPGGDVFDSGKLTLNRNIKHKPQRANSPPKRTTTTLNFTSSKTSPATSSRLPRFQPSLERHDRVRSNLEPVSESGAPVSRYPRPSSRLAGHVVTSTSAIPGPSTPTPPSTPSRRGLRNADSRSDMRYEPPTTTNAQLLRSKRSMPVMRNLASPSKPPQYPRPPSRHDSNGVSSRLNIPARPKTPVDRAEPRIGDARRAAPFLPAGGSTAQSHHISIKTGSTRHSRRNDSEGSNDSMSAAQKSLSRLAAIGRPETPGRGRSSMTAAELAAQAKKTMTKPARRRNFGDGTELEIFDDLPTSATTESKFTKIPIGRGAPRSLRSKLGLSHFAPSTTSLSSARAGTETPMSGTPLSPTKQVFPTSTSNVPRFARDTASSRNARESRTVSTTYQPMRGEPLQPVSANWRAAAPPRQPLALRKKHNKLPQKPHLIKPLGHDLNRPKEENGMQYNPLLFRWEGNENALAPFDVPEFHPRGQSPTTAGSSTAKNEGSPNSKANVALIMNVGSASSGVQVVGGMVFDPRRMCWLKVAEGDGGNGLRGGVGSVKLEEEEDVFAGLEDLKEEAEEDVRSQRSSAFSGGGGGAMGGFSMDALIGGKSSAAAAGKDADGKDAHSSGDEWGVAEEFDVGPDFVRRQRGEEEKWKGKVEKWLRTEEEVQREDVEGLGGWRWAIRELVLGDQM